MFQGTGSDVGKSLLVAGIARALTRRGFSVAPFKTQNMSNNAAVTTDGGEIGRAQALQARACGLAPSVHMNPVLLKPQSEIGAQVVVQGKVIGNANAREYQSVKPTLMPAVLESYHHLAARADIVLVEGAGSASEVNLRAGDIANMGFACAAKAPVILIGDIDRGGVIASLCGTMQLLSDEEKALVKGYVINKFRGDTSLFDDGLTVIQQQTGLDSLGVIPWFDRATDLPAEDALALQNAPARTNADARLRIAVLSLARIANFDDFDPLIAEPDVDLFFVRSGEAIPGNVDLVIIPGSKATLPDLMHLREQGWDVDLHAHLRRGGVVLGICGGYQMLGHTLSDPAHIEGTVTSADGLGWLDVNTTMTRRKALRYVSGHDSAHGCEVRAYEMHIGETSGPGVERPMVRLEASDEHPGGEHGAVSADGRVLGCYLHGLFAADRFRHAFLNSLRARDASALRYEQQVDATLDALAEHLEHHVDILRVIEAAGVSQ